LLNRLERVERPQDFPEMQFEFQPIIDSGQMVLSTQKLAAGYVSLETAGWISATGRDEGAASRGPTLELLRGDRVGLLGPNGAGKTTLLRTIIGELEPVSGQVNIGHNVRIGYYSQTHTGLNTDRTIVDEIRQVTNAK